DKSKSKSSTKSVQSEELEFEVVDSDMPHNQEENLVSDAERKFVKSSLVAPNLASRCSSTRATDVKSRSVDGGFVASVVGGGVDVDCCGGGVK
nr:hypothetical protein [Tanacetum cinerariifolium]